MPADDVKRLAIMQPYFFPYLGYFQLLHAVDTFVFYDDVNFIKNGWINRNRILLDGAPAYFTVPLANASPFAKINEIQTSRDAIWRRKLAEKLRHAYGRAPHYSSVAPLIATVLDTDVANIGEMAKRSIKVVAAYLSIECAIVESSAVYGNQELRGEERVLDICKRENAGSYINLPGGRDLYSAAHFSAAHLGLAFIEPGTVAYPQFCDPYVGQLSVIDVLMFNSRDRARDLLGSYQVIRAAQPVCDSTH